MKQRSVRYAAALSWAVNIGMLSALRDVLFLISVV
jgi:hypothetical protein